MATAVEKAREALARCDWTAAYSALSGFDTETADAEALETIADAAWWTSRMEECIVVRERAFSLHEQAGRKREAANLALHLFENHAFRNRPAVASGWLGRARRLLADEPECRECGVLLVREAESEHAAGDVDRALATAERALEVARRLDDPDLEGQALQAIGQLRIAAGRPAEGLAAFDEAMVLATQGRLGPLETGRIYCSLIGACEELSDHQRAAEWTEFGSRWSHNHPRTIFPGLCRLHRATVLQLRGDWAEAEEEARRAYDELRDVSVPNSGAAFYAIGEIRRRMGDVDGAEDAFRRADELGFQPQPGLALLRLAQGRVDAASTSIARVVAEQSWNRLSRAKLLPAQVEIAIVAGDLERARAAADEIGATASDFDSPGLRAAATLARGRVELAENDTEACATLRRAVHELQALELPYEVASTRVLLAQACRLAGDEDAAEASLDAAAAIFQRLGATRDAERLGELRGGRSALLPGGLTEREAEVLRLVASGSTNKQVAAELFLSEKTVARHLSNIFAKIGVSSRSAATAYAFQHGIVGAAH